MKDNIDKLINLMRFLKDSYKRQAFLDIEFGMALVKHHMDDFDVVLDDEGVYRIAFLLQPVK